MKEKTDNGHKNVLSKLIRHIVGPTQPSREYYVHDKFMISMLSKLINGDRRGAISALEKYSRSVRPAAPLESSKLLLFKVESTLLVFNQSMLTEALNILFSGLPEYFDQVHHNLDIFAYNCLEQHGVAPQSSTPSDAEKTAGLFYSELILFSRFCTCDPLMLVIVSLTLCLTTRYTLTSSDLIVLNAKGSTLDSKSLSLEGDIEKSVEGSVLSLDKRYQDSIEIDRSDAVSRRNQKQ